MSDATTSPNDFAVKGTASDSPVLAPGGIGGNGEPFRADQVEKQVALKGGNAPPGYPAVLRDSGIEGKVVAMFVVDERGRVEDSTVKFVSADNSLFQEAVRVALERMRFIPAEVGGKTVRQLVQMPFVFTLQK
jgi:protein TonB